METLKNLIYKRPFRALFYLPKKRKKRYISAVFAFKIRVIVLCERCEMKIKYNLDKSTLHVYFIGELDECTASKTREIIDGLISDINGIKKVVFNLSELTFMDSTGIGVFIGRYKKFKSKNIAVFVENPSKTVDKILQISGLYKIMPAV